MKLSLRAQLITFSLVIMALNILIGIIGLTGMTKTDNGLEKVYGEGFIQLERLKEISDDYAVFIIDAVNKANAGVIQAEEALEGIKKANERIKKNWGAYTEIKLESDEEKIAGEANALFKDADLAVENLSKALVSMKGNVSGKLASFDGPLYKSIDPITSKISELAILKQNKAETLKEMTDRMYSSFRTAVIVIVLSGLVFSILIGLSVMKTGIKLMSFTLQSMREIAGKNISFNVPEEITERRDETGAVARSVKKLLNSMGEIIKELSDNAEFLSSSSSDLEKTAEQLSASAGETSRKLGGIASGSENLSKNVNDMAKASETISEESESVASAIEEMSASLKETAMSCEKNAVIARKADEQTESTLKTMSELNSYATQIGQVVEVINSIADQTNMLALNATIEAARAGEAGKGFAVVANEVKELASQSRQSTGEIAMRVDKIQSESGAAMKSMQDISSIIKNLNEISSGIAAAVEEQNATTNEIARNVASVSSSTNSLSSGVRSSAMIADESTKNIHSISEESGKVADYAKLTRESAVKLADIAEKMNLIVSKFKL